MDGEREGVDALPDRLGEWVDRRAAELGTDRAGVLARAVVVLRTIEGEADDAAVDPHRLEERVAELEVDVDAKIGDVRDRVVQLKREVDAKARADHDHPDLREGTAEARRAAAEASDRAESAADAAAAADERVTAGFENFEAVLSHLRDETDDNAAKLDAAGRTLLDLRARVADLERAAARDEVAADIRAEANRRGVTVATCESCGATVSLGLLDAPACPGCDATFDGLGPDPGLLRKPVLTVGEPPALAAAPDPAETPADPFDSAADRAAGESSASEPEFDPEPVEAPADGEVDDDR